MKELVYPSKLLLFGEYAIIKGGRALAIPFSRFSGHWARAKENTPQQETLRSLAFYLGQLQQSGALKCSFDQNAFLKIWKKDCIFIPIFRGAMAWEVQER
jgi:hypothetical protein